MIDTPDQQPEDDDTTAPPDPTHEATTPPSNPEADVDAVREGAEQLDRAGGGH